MDSNKWQNLGCYLGQMALRLLGHVSQQPVTDVGNTRDAKPLGQNFFISCRFWKKFGQIVGWSPLWEILDLTLTAIFLKEENIAVTTDPQISWIFSLLCHPKKIQFVCDKIFWKGSPQNIWQDYRMNREQKCILTFDLFFCELLYLQYKEKEQKSRWDMTYEAHSRKL